MMKEFLDFVKPPVVEEDVSDTGSALFVPALRLCVVRLVMGMVLMVFAFTRYDRWDYRFYFGYQYIFSHIPSVFYIFLSITLFVLSAASFLVAFDCSVKISGPFVEAMYFTSFALSIAGTTIDSTYYPALFIMFGHFAMGPKIRVRPWFIAMSVLGYVPHIIRETFSRHPNHVSSLVYLPIMVVHTCVGAMVLVLTEMMKYAEFKPEKRLVAAPRHASYSAI